jgi:hypothetical protein
MSTLIELTMIYLTMNFIVALVIILMELWES